MGVVLFTDAALFALRVTVKIPRYALHQVGQFQQAGRVQR